MGHCSSDKVLGPADSVEETELGGWCSRAELPGQASRRGLSPWRLVAGVFPTDYSPRQAKNSMLHPCPSMEGLACPFSARPCDQRWV